MSEKIETVRKSFLVDNADPSSENVVMEMAALRDTSDAGGTKSTRSKAGMNDIEEGPEGGRRDDSPRSSASLRGSASPRGSASTSGSGREGPPSAAAGPADPADPGGRSDTLLRSPVPTTSNVGALGGVGLRKILLGVGGLIAIIVCIVFREHIFGAGMGALNGKCRPEDSTNPRCDGDLVCDTDAGTCIEKEEGGVDPNKQGSGEQGPGGPLPAAPQTNQVGLLIPQMLGTWYYGNHGSRYTISSASPDDPDGVLHFEETNKQGPISGNLEHKGEFWEGKPKYTNGTVAGTIRLRHSPVLVSIFAPQGEEFRQPVEADKADALGAVNGKCRPEDSAPRCDGDLVCDTSAGTCVEEVGLLHPQMLGTWHYGNHNYQYTISRASPGASPGVLHFYQKHTTLGSVSGNLERKLDPKKGEFWEGKLMHTNDAGTTIDAGKMRLFPSSALDSTFVHEGQTRERKWRAYRDDA